MSADDFRFWHWPDRIIRLRESRRLREEHNRLMNDHARLTSALAAFQNKLTEEEERQRGETLAKLLNLKQCRPTFDPPRYETAWGTKTALGLYRTVAAVIIDGEKMR